jgi:hypothetical protein
MRTQASCVTIGTALVAVAAAVAASGCNGRLDNGNVTGAPSRGNDGSIDALPVNATNPRPDDSGQSNAPDTWCHDIPCPTLREGGKSVFQSDACIACTRGYCALERSACAHDTSCRSAGDVFDTCMSNATAADGEVNACLEAFAGSGPTASAVTACMKSHCANVCLP